MKNKYDFELIMIEQKDNSIEIEIECNFVPASRPRVSRFGTYISEPYKSFKKEFYFFVKNKLSAYGNSFKGKSLSIDMSFYKQIPKSYSKKKKEECLIKGCITRPDIDNYYKAILDSMDNIFYTDDSYVVELSGRKLYTIRNSFVKLKIKEFEG